MTTTDWPAFLAARLDEQEKRLTLHEDWNTLDQRFILHHHNYLARGKENRRYYYMLRPESVIPAHNAVETVREHLSATKAKP